MSKWLSAALLAFGCGGATSMGPPITSSGMDAGQTPVMPTPVMPTHAGVFPAGFLWGTSTAPYQVEGGLHSSDWYQWESTSNNKTGDHADDGPKQYEHYDEDFALTEQLGANAARLGIDWSRIFPSAEVFPNQPDIAAVKHYHDLFASMKAHHQIPVVTLYHWAFPTWIQDLKNKDKFSGWMDSSIDVKFGQWAQWAAKEYGGEVDYWITQNEPIVTIGAGYLNGQFPPIRKVTDIGGIDNAELAYYNMERAHVAEYNALKMYDTIDADGDGKAAFVGISMALPAWEAKGSGDTAALQRWHYIWNQVFLNAIINGDIDYDLDEKLDGTHDQKANPMFQNKLDWIGVNYYGIAQAQALPFGFSYGPFNGTPNSYDLDDNRPHSEIGMSIYPEGFRTTFNELQPYHLPIYVTENGIADSTDAQRPRYIADYLTVVQKAVVDGVDVRGYFYWAQVDNYEWQAGFCARYGLIHVDYTKDDRPRSTGEGYKVYQQIIKDGQVDPALLTKYPNYPKPTKKCSFGG